MGDSVSLWLNTNQGVLTLVLFVATLALGWTTGLFDALRRRPKFRVRLIDGPTFSCTFGTGAKHGRFDVHRTGIALYLHITNVGSAPANIDDISVGYRWAVRPLSGAWWRFGLFRFWLSDQTTALEDFQVSIGDNTKVYPFLVQASSMTPRTADTFLEIGRSTNGVIYFEQSDSWGGCFPIARQNRIHLKLVIKDSFGGRHTRRVVIPRVTMAEARKYNPSFGKTFSTLQGGSEPIELPVDQHGNLIAPMPSKP